MENLARDVSMYINNEMRLLEIKAENDVLLQRIKQLETKINRLKKSGETPYKKESVLNAMVSKSLYLLAEKDTLQVIGTSLISQQVLQRMITTRFQYLMDRFKRKLFHKRLQRAKFVRHLHHLDYEIVQ